MEETKESTPVELQEEEKKEETVQAPLPEKKKTFENRYSRSRRSQRTSERKSTEKTTPNQRRVCIK